MCGRPPRHGRRPRALPSVPCWSPCSPPTPTWPARPTARNERRGPGRPSTMASSRPPNSPRRPSPGSPHWRPQSPNWPAGSSWRRRPWASCGSPGGPHRRDQTAAAGPFEDGQVSTRGGTEPKLASTRPGSSPEGGQQHVNRPDRRPPGRRAPPAAARPGGEIFAEGQDSPPAPPVYADVTAPGERKPVIPAHWRTWAAAREHVRLAAARHRHAAAYHGVRAPCTWCSPVGGHSWGSAARSLCCSPGGTCRTSPNWSGRPKRDKSVPTATAVPKAPQVVPHSQPGVSCGAESGLSGRPMKGRAHTPAPPSSLDG
jgi:hypothetical protein